MTRRPIQSVCVIGLGYVGLPTAVLIADSGLRVTGVDIREEWISELSSGNMPLDEPGLQARFLRAVSKGLTFSTKPVMADVFVIAVPTPVHADRLANLDLLESAVASIVPVLKERDLIVIESTIPPTTTDRWLPEVLRRHGWDDVSRLDVAHCPERILPGRIMHELVHNARIIGGTTPRATMRASSLYRMFVDGKLLETNAVNAEMTKLMENTFRDVNIALSNELVKISSVLPIEPLEIIRMANYHPRVHLLQPGPGVGGHCIAVDPYFIVEKALNETPLIQTARHTNATMPEFIAKRLLQLLTGIPSPKIAVFGLAYKGNVADTRESPSLEIVKLLSSRPHVRLNLHDPMVHPNSIFHGHSNMTAIEAASNADMLIVLTDHACFGESINDALLALMRTPLVVDTRNCIRKESITGGTVINFDSLFADRFVHSIL